MRRIIYYLIPLGVHRIYQRYIERENRELFRLIKLRRYEQTTTNLLGKEITINDGNSFVYMYDNIIKRKMYEFSSSKTDPYIIDGGENIGLSVIYFKQAYPNSRLIAFEPDPDIFKILENNCENIALTKVKLVNKAL